MDKLTPKQRSANMSRIRSQDTQPEMLVRRAVHAMGYRYRLHDSNLPGKPDLVLPRLGKIIQVQGCFWHQHSGCIDAHIPKSRRHYWAPKLQRNSDRDKKNARALRRMGWKLLTVWECEIKDMGKLKSRLARFLRQ